MILIDAVYINNGGGKILLDYLIQELQKTQKQVVYLLDQRVENSVPYLSKSSSEVIFIKASLYRRHKFYLKNRHRFITVLCFGDLPPSLHLNATVYTYFHQKLYITFPKDLPVLHKVMFTLKRTVLRYLIKYSDYWIVQTDAMQSSFQKKFNVPSEKLLLMPFYPLVKVSGFSEKIKNTYIYPSNGSSHKNHVRLINAFCAFYDSHKTGMLIVTIDDNFPDLRNLIDEKIALKYPIKNIGFVSPEVLAQLYQSSEYLVYPSLAESFGLGVVEALEYGCKVIGADLSYMHAVCNPSIVFNPMDEDAIAKAFAQTINTEVKPSVCLMQNKISDLLHILNDHKICSKTIMDTSDPRIVFNSAGESDYYLNFKKRIEPNWKRDDKAFKQLMKLAAKIKKRGKEKDFNCIIGVSGGLDSSYLTYVAKEIMGLTPLLFHVDAGWNTHKAVGNIEKLVNGLQLDLYTEVINWEEMKDLQRAFFKSQVADQDLPQDVAFFSAMYKFAKKNKIKYVLTGANYSTECCREPEEWGAYPGIDKKLIDDIYSKFGTDKLKTFPIVDILDYKLYYKYLYGITVVKPLNLLPYIKEDAEKLMEEKFGWDKLQHKHHESRFTRFFEDYWLPQKFGFDKRKAHLSSLILTGQMTREAALERISKPELDASTLRKEFEYVAEKLDFTVEEFKEIFEGENRTYHHYKNKRKLIGLGSHMMTFLGLENRLFR